MAHSNSKPSRRKLLIWGAAVVSSIGLFKWFRRVKKEKKETVTMLTQEGTLVEVDKHLLGTAGRKISNKELQQWIKK